ncbi:MAG: hypothetical protein MJY99_00275 [Fibrobacter sp.]|uniref:hypothetical protein n=1 Tax=Fibrobacter sp. TaxID=35828 RepID=UPI00388F39F4|nr:hypothetical protein [Fibrobacter sp.]
MKAKSSFSLLLLAVSAFLLASCASAPEPEVEFRPVQLSWNALSEEAENFPAKDVCVIKVTASLSQESVVVASKNDNLEYVVSFDIGGPGLEFSGIQANLSMLDTPEYKWNATCDSTGNVVVKFHNGQ